MSIIAGLSRSITASKTATTNEGLLLTLKAIGLNIYEGKRKFQNLLFFVVIQKNVS